MDRRDRTNERLVALFVLGVLLLVPPLLAVFNRPYRLLGVPVLYLYLFAAWSLLIGLAAAVVNQSAAIEPVDPAPAEGDGDA